MQIPGQASARPAQRARSARAAPLCHGTYGICSGHVDLREPAQPSHHQQLLHRVRPHSASSHPARCQALALRNFAGPAPAVHELKMLHALSAYTPQALHQAVCPVQGSWPAASRQHPRPKQDPVEPGLWSSRCRRGAAAASGVIKVRTKSLVSLSHQLSHHVAV